MFEQEKFLESLLKHEKKLEELNAKGVFSLNAFTTTYRMQKVVLFATFDEDSQKKANAYITKINALHDKSFSYLRQDTLETQLLQKAKNLSEEIDLAKSQIGSPNENHEYLKELMTRSQAANDKILKFTTKILENKNLALNAFMKVFDETLPPIIQEEAEDIDNILEGSLNCRP